MQGKTVTSKTILNTSLGKIVRFYPQAILQTGKERPEYYLVLITGDLTALLLSLFLAVGLRAYLGNLFPHLSAYSWEQALKTFQKFWWLFLPVPLALAYQRVYDRRLPFWDETKEIVKGLILAFVIIYALMAMKKIGTQVSRLTVGFTFLFSLILFSSFRYLVKHALFRIPLFRRKALILGAGSGAKELIQGLQSETYLGYEVIGLLDDDPSKHGQYIAGKKVYGAIRQISKFVTFLGVESVFIAVPSFSSRQLSDLFASVQGLVKEVCIVPEFKNFGMLNAETYTLFREKIFLIKVQNNLKSPFNQFIKRNFDIIVSLFLLPLLLPIIGIISLLIILDSPGSPIFVQKRLGKGGKLFNVYKFRTMYKNADAILAKYLEKNPEAQREWYLYRKLRGQDPRVTRFGKFLRKTSLDELPQIFNVLKGEMSLVGPRPYLPREENDMNGLESIILQTQPGITGLWQVSGRNDVTFQDRLKMDVWYVLNWSLWLDLTLLIRTIRVVLKREGSY